MRRASALAAVFLLILGCGLFAPGGASSSPALKDKDRLLTETRRELAQVRSATAKYLDIQRAIDDGYVNIDVFVSGQGFHYLKPGFLDDHFQLDKPELLVYAADPSKNALRLVAIEYAVPANLVSGPPEGFTGDDDKWDLNEDFGLWTLHCWAWLENPNGMFAEFSPRVP